MKIRKGLMRDAESCLKIAELDRATHWKLEDFRNSTTDVNAVFLVAEEQKKTIGYILGFIVPTGHREALIHETRVHRAFRGKNIGTDLVEQFCKYVNKRGVKSVTVLIDPKHRQFYIKSCKFKEIGKWIEVTRKLYPFFLKK